MRKAMKIISPLNRQLVPHCTLSTNKYTRGISESHFKPSNLTVQHSRPSRKVFKVPHPGWTLWESLTQHPVLSWLAHMSQYIRWQVCSTATRGVFELSCQKLCLSTTASPRTWQLLHTRAAHTPLPANGDHHRPPVGSRVAFTFGNISAIMFYYLIWKDSL